MPTTAQDLINRTLRLIGQPADSDVGALPSGVDQTPTITSTATLLFYLTAAQNDLARTCVPIFDTALFTIASGQSTPPYSTLTTTAGRIVRVPSALYRVPATGPRVALTQAKYGQSVNGFWSTPGQIYAPDASGNPTAFSDLTVNAVLATPVAASTNFSMDAFCLPIPLTAANTNVDPMVSDEEILKLATYFCAVSLVWQNADFPDLQSRAQIWFQAYMAGRKAQYARLVSNDDSLSAYFAETTPFADLPVTPPQRKSEV